MCNMQDVVRQKVVPKENCIVSDWFRYSRITDGFGQSRTDFVRNQYYVGILFKVEFPF